MDLLLTRLIHTCEATVGVLSLAGIPFCQVLEGAVLPPEALPQLAHVAIPVGTYDVVLTYSTRFRQPLPLLLHVRGHEDVRIRGDEPAAPGVGASGHDLRVGTHYPRHPGQLFNGPAVYHRLFTHLQAARDAGAAIRLTIA